MCIHNLDVCCWVKDAWPVSAQGQGGRQVRGVPDQMFDHFAMEYTFADGTRLFAQGRHLAGCWGFFGDVIHGAKGSAVLGEGQPKPHIYRGHAGRPKTWSGSTKALPAILTSGSTTSCSRRSAKTSRTTRRSLREVRPDRHLGPHGRRIRPRNHLAGGLDLPVRLAPGLEKITSWACPPPVMPDAKGRYPVAMPGITKVL